MAQVWVKAYGDLALPKQQGPLSAAPMKSKEMYSITLGVGLAAGTAGGSQT